MTVKAIIIHRQPKASGEARKPHEYKLGLGPCGRVVTGLGSFNDGPNGLFVVVQTVEGGDKVYFSYPLEHVDRTAVYHYDPDVCVTCLPEAR